MKIFAFFLFASLCCLPFQGHAETALFGGSKPEHIVVHNRVLAKVNGKAISVVDLMKKMDMLFYREYPQYSSFPEARHQFYSSSWRYLLQELVDKELIIADAEENKLPVSSGDVRQEMEHLFGPNIIENLSKIGMTFDEAWKIVQGDITLQRMLYVRVNAKAARNVTPRDVYAAYEQFAKENRQLDQWKYRVISIRDKDPSAGAATANIAHQFLAEDNISLEELSGKIQAVPLASTSQITISDAFIHNDQEIADAYKNVLKEMSPKSYSRPITQLSKDKSTVFRLFYFESMTPGGAPPFKEVANKLKDMLIQKQVSEQSQIYLKRLRRHFDVQEMIPEGFEPFTLE